MKHELIQAMHHSLMAGGKRLRPILCLSSAMACGGDPEYALPAACALEMIHTYSLIHDDLPAMDDDDLRRGLITCHKKYSEATAILAGDALLTHAFTLLSDKSAPFDKYPKPDICIQLIRLISHAAGTNGMVEGQMMDMQSFSGDQDNTLSHLEKIHYLKTGQMIIASVKAGAVSVVADKERIDQLGSYARKIGMAFQVMDDILNVEGDPKKLGKAVGSDEKNAKMTFPAIIGLDESKIYAKKLITDAINALELFDQTAAPLRAIAEYIIKRDH
ncbi:MAG: polyprenyl synthetase family protein [Desulfobacteraceae bacterium]|nr:polyprenyl synthetase family protein [Desulfobacteraceae bacterium]